jgi:hypothetical protein
MFDFRFRLLTALLVTAFVGMPTMGMALQYQLVHLDQNSVALTFTGPIVPGDFERLNTFLQSVPSSDDIKAIFIDSGGGNVVEASKIAALFNKTAAVVVVPSGSQCASACFLLFAAAAQRAVAPDALIGVHSANDNGQEDIDSMAFTTAVAREAAAYGVPPSIIGKMVQTEPNRVTWLDPSDLAAMHVKVIEANATEPAGPPSQSQQNGVSQPQQGPAGLSQGAASPSSSWIQIYSRALLSEVVSLGTSYKGRFNNGRIFRCNNGWYVLVLGPYEPAVAIDTRDRLVASGDIPKDSLVTQGATFEQLAWGDEVNPGASTTPNLSAGIALEAATGFFRTSTLSQKEALSFLDRIYPAELIYFGKKASKAYVLNDKQAFMERWPNRAYSMRPGSISTSCDPRDNSCTVTGIVDWRASSTERNATSTGSARFQLTFSTQGRPTLLSEWSEVLTRSNRTGP